MRSTSLLLVLILACSSLVSLVYGHSFVTCTDYRPTSVSIPSVDRQPETCKGYPRRYYFRDQQGDGYTFRPASGSVSPCDPVKQFRASDVVGAYSSKYPMAVYKKGNDVCIQWPARNHALGFNGPFLNSGTNLVFMSPTHNMTRDPTQTEFNKGKVAEMSFSDCSADDPSLSAAENSNNRPCRGCFKLPTNMPTGYYTFQWWWEFNVGEFYSTCWDAMINDNASTYSKSFQTKPADSPTSFKRSGPPIDFTNNNREPIQTHPLLSGAPTSPPPTSPPTQAPTQAPTQGPTQAPTQGPTGGPTQAPTQAPTQGPTSAPGSGPGKNYAFTIVNSWPGGFQATLDINLAKAVSGWSVTFDLPGATVVNLWNGNLVSGSSPNKVNNPDWLKDIAAGGKISLGMVISGSAQSRPTKVTLQGVDVPSSSPTPAPTSAPTQGPTQAPTQGPTGGPTQAPTQAPTAGPTQAPGTPGCSHTSLTFTSANGRLYVNNIPFDFKGVNWFGFETDIYVPHGCWTFQSVTQCYNYIFDFLKKNKFNALRIPVTVEMILNNPSVNSFPFSNTNALSVLDNLIDTAAGYGILIMLDIHRLHHSLGISELWYDSTWTMAKVKDSITTLANRYSNRWNVFALDLKNEPHGAATWGDGNAATDWRLAAEDMANHLIGLNLNKWLIFVEGVERSPSPQFNCYWGENLVGVRNNPIRISQPERLVYSPHAYGPSVFRQPFHPPTATNFPSNLDAIWDYKFGYVKDLTGRAVVIGEWGGFYTDDDKRYQDQMALYMISRGMRSNFYWCLNPNSGDTGGILANDWRTPVTSKLNLLNSILPNPTTITKQGSNFCIQNTQAVDSEEVNIVDVSAVSEYKVTYQITWESVSQLSFGGSIQLSTVSGVSDWKLAFSFPAGQTIQSVTNAKIISAGPEVILGPDNNSVVANGTSITITFVAKFPTVNTSPYTFTVSSGENSPVVADSILFESNQNTPTVSPDAPTEAPSASSTLILSVTLTICSFFLSFLI